MLIEGVDRILRRIREQGLVDNLGARDLMTPEGCGIDFRLQAAYRIVGGGAFIDADGCADLGRRKGVATEQVMSFVEGAAEQDYLTIKPGDYYLVQTIEVVNMPADLMAQVYPRSSLYRSGLLLLASKADPGYRGPFILGLSNIGPVDVKLQMGARICNVVFVQVAGATVAYRGQHQGGRVTPEATERQVQRCV
jgi:deoxycytidine triphosphate deaminase